MIRVSTILLIDENNDLVGEIDTAEAKRMAYDAGLDLVEVAGDKRPPVCRILDFGKWKYEQSKKDRAQKAKSKTLDTKEVRLGRSMKIDPHDIQIRLNQARKFLMEGHRVQIVQNFRGREMQHRERGFDRIKDIIEQMSDIAKVEMTPRLAGRRLTLLLAPDKVKIDNIRKREESKKVTAAKAAQNAEEESAASPPKSPTAVPDSPIAEKVSTQARAVS